VVDYLIEVESLEHSLNIHPDQLEVTVLNVPHVIELDEDFREVGRT
jgi:hypothetical protein